MGCLGKIKLKRMLKSNLSTTATLGTEKEKSGRFVEVAVMGVGGGGNITSF